jgi:glutamate--cysteine ligase
MYNAKDGRVRMSQAATNLDTGSWTRPLSYEDLLRPFIAACKPRSHWRIGTESGRFGVRSSTGDPIHYEGPGALLEVFEILVSRFGWNAPPEAVGGPPIQLRRGASSITLEAGGQLRLSGAPQADIHQVHEETRMHLAEMARLSENLGLSWMGIGFQPLARQQDLDGVPEQRYAVMREYLASRGTLARDMMCRTSSVQVNLDYASPDDAARKLRVALRVTPIVSAMFANAPFVDGRLFGGRSMRMRVWFDVDPDRQGLVPRMWSERSTLHDYIEWALDVPMFLIKRNHAVVANTGQTFRSFMREGFWGQRATLDDWEMHLGTLFPEVRLKRTLQMRGADSLPFEIMCGLPALWTGLIYDSTSLAQVERLSESWTVWEMDELREDAATMGLAAPFRGAPVARVAERVLQIARDGLRRRARRRPDTQEDETVYLDPIARFVEHGITPADKLMEGLGGRSQIRADILRRVRP